MLQYTYLLTSQLEAQRLYFEEKMERIEAEAMKQVFVFLVFVQILDWTGPLQGVNSPVKLMRLGGGGQ